MRKLGIAVALASTAMATPALARDHSFYVGVEGGAMLVEDQRVDNFDPSAVETPGGATNGEFSVKYGTGLDVDLIGGYDFGMVRLEAELGWKRAGIDGLEIRNFPLTGIPFGSHINTDGHGRALSGMINGLLDFGDEDSWSGYVGAGIGLADVRVSMGEDPEFPGLVVEGSDSRPAWQAIMGVRTAVSPNIDVGLKYRFFNVPNLKFDDSSGLGFNTLRSKWRSHSLLLSLTYNFAAPPPPPPPATQTCPDGSVILATDACPAPPPPPPPPPPAPERGL
jgi:opacity protein-like surface antigen